MVSAALVAELRQALIESRQLRTAADTSTREGSKYYLARIKLLNLLEQNAPEIIAALEMSVV